MGGQEYLECQLVQVQIYFLLGLNDSPLIILAFLKSDLFKYLLFVLSFSSINFHFFCTAAAPTPSPPGYDGAASSFSFSTAFSYATPSSKPAPLSSLLQKTAQCNGNFYKTSAGVRRRIWFNAFSK